MRDENAALDVFEKRCRSDYLNKAEEEREQSTESKVETIKERCYHILIDNELKLNVLSPRTGTTLEILRTSGANELDQLRRQMDKMEKTLEKILRRL